MNVSSFKDYFIKNSDKTTKTYTVALCSLFDDTENS